MDSSKNIDIDEKKIYFEEIPPQKNMKYNEMKIDGFLHKIQNTNNNFALKNSFKKLKVHSEIVSSNEFNIFESRMKSSEGIDYIVICKLIRENSIIMVKTKEISDIVPLVISSPIFSIIDLDVLELSSSSFIIYENFILPRNNHKSNFEIPADNSFNLRNDQNINQTITTIDLQNINEGPVKYRKSKSSNFNSKPSDKRGTPSSEISKSHLGIETLSRIRRGSNQSQFSFTSLADAELKIDSRINPIIRRNSGQSLRRSSQSSLELFSDKLILENSKNFVAETAKFLAHHEASLNESKNLNRTKSDNAFFFKKEGVSIPKRRSSQINLPYQIIIQPVTDGLIIPNFSQINSSNSNINIDEEPKIVRHKEIKQNEEYKFDNENRENFGKSNFEEFTKFMRDLDKNDNSKDKKIKKSPYMSNKRIESDEYLINALNTTKAEVKIQEMPKEIQNVQKISYLNESSELEGKVKIESPLKAKQFRKEKSLKILTFIENKNLPESIEDKINNDPNIKRSPENIRKISKKNERTKAKNPKSKGTIYVARDSSRHMNKLTTLKSPTTTSNGVFDFEEKQERENLNQNEFHLFSLSHDRSLRRTITGISEMKRRESSLAIKNTLIPHNPNEKEINKNIDFHH